MDERTPRELGYCFLSFILHNDAFSSHQFSHNFFELNQDSAQMNKVMFNWHTFFHKHYKGGLQIKLLMRELVTYMTLI